MPTFADNAEYFMALEHARECSLVLCMYAVRIQRIRITPSGVVVEIDQPLSIDEVQRKGQWSAVELRGCSVAWKS
jgi:hypothetical protein